MANSISLGALGLKELLTLSPDERLKALERNKAAGIISPEAYTQGIADAEEFRKQLTQTPIPQAGLETGRMGEYPKAFGNRGLVDTLFGSSPTPIPVVPSAVTGGVGVPTSPAIASNLPASVQPMIPKTPIGGVGGKTQEDFMQDIQKTRVEPTTGIIPVSMSTPINDAGYIRNNETGVGFRVSRPTDGGGVSFGGVNISPTNIAPTVDYNAKIEDLINQVINDPHSRVTQSMGLGGGIKTGGIKENVLREVIELRKAQLGLQGQQMTSQSASEDRRVNMALGLMGRQDTVAARREAMEVTREGYGIQAKEGEERNRLAREKQAWEIKKFDESNSLKDPMNYLKVLDMLSPYILDAMDQPTKNKDFTAGAKALEEAGYPIPKGMKIPELKPKVPIKGDMVKGYRFKGGNPADPNSWEKI